MDYCNAWQADLNRAFGKIYFAIYSVDLTDGKYLEVSTLDIFRKRIPPEGEANFLFNMVVTYYVSEGFKDTMREFLSTDTLDERLSEQNAVSCEFFGTTQGWCRASLVVEKRAGDGKVQRFAYVTQEINEEVKTEQRRIAELKAAYAAVEAANNAKSSFLFCMSHDIRTPLNAIMGFESLIEQSAENADAVREYASKIKISGNLLLSLLNEILDMTKLQGGLAVLKHERFALSELTDGLDTVIRPQINAKEQLFTFERTGDVHDAFVGDKACISRILFNILCNAVKYTEPSGKIVFSISEEPSGAEGNVTLVFSVRDNGIGMTPELKSKVFDEFIRGGETGDNSGAGLGLTIAKGFAEMMGGTIAVKSEPGEGSEFTVKIPLEIADAETCEEPEADDIDFRGMNILVVEDNELNMEIITGILTMAGAKCDSASGGAEAIEKVAASREGEYDVIIMDIQMPDMDGCETTRRIRAMDREDTGSIPVVALTANAFEEDVRSAMDAGMDAHMAKPFDVNVFKKTLVNLKVGE